LRIRHLLGRCQTKGHLKNGLCLL